VPIPALTVNKLGGMMLCMYGGHRYSQYDVQEPDYCGCAASRHREEEESQIRTVYRRAL
jgi:hypothetical protein